VAVQFFNQALDLIDDPESTPQAPTQAAIENIYQLVSVAQSLVADSDVTTLRGVIRGVPRRRLVPILFGSNRTTLNNRGRRLANQLAQNLKRRKVTQVTLYGHSDPDGSHAVCDRVSRQRANAVKNYLRSAGVRGRIYVKGMGKRQPLRLANRWRLSEAKIDALSRRVEFRINK
jgi:outer membrane protein OmpA-like peptidoglycan-associated protein